DEAAVLGAVADVAGTEIAVGGKGCGSGLGVAVVAEHEAGPAQLDLTRFTRRAERTGIGIADAYRSLRRGWHAAGQGVALAIACRLQGEQRLAFAHAVQAAHRHATRGRPLDQARDAGKASVTAEAQV